MRNAGRIVAIVVAAFLLLSLLDSFVVVEMLVRRTGLPLLLAVLNLLAMLGCGFAVRGLRGRVWRADEESAALDPPLDLVIGYPLFGTLCFLVATVHASAWTLMPLTSVCALFGLYVIVRRYEAGTPAVASIHAVIPSVSEGPGREGRTNAPFARTAQPRSLATLGMTGGDLFALVALVLVFLAGFVAAQAPPLSLDELAYHLAVPRTWIHEGRAVALPLLSHSYFPLGIESADLPLLAVLDEAGGIASHFVHLAVAIATALLVHRLTKRNLLATAAIVTTPALALTAGWSLVDWPLLGICVALVLALDTDDDAGACAAIGAGLLTKYTFIPLAVIALVAARRWRPALPGLAIGSIFFIRNLILTGNPVAPFLSANAPHVSGYRAGAFLTDYVFDGRFLDESLGASLLSLAALTAGQLGWLLVAAGAGLFLLAPSSRLLIPFLAISAARASEKLASSRVMRAIVICAVTVQLLLVAYFLDRTEAFAVLAGRTTDAELLAKQRPSTAAVAWLNDTLPPTSRTLVIGLAETYGFERRVRGSGNFDGPRMSAYLATPTPEALYAQLRRDGITHVAIVAAPPPTLVEKKVEERTTLLTPPAQRMLAQTLDRYAGTVTSGPNTALFALR